MTIPHVASASRAPTRVVLTFALPAGEVPGVKKGEVRVHFSGSARSPPHRADDARRRVTSPSRPTRRITDRARLSLKEFPP